MNVHRHGHSIIKGLLSTKGVIRTDKDDKINRGDNRGYKDIYIYKGQLTVSDEWAIIGVNVCRHRIIREIIRRFKKTIGLDVQGV